jgi:hypothetical protein
MVNTNFEIAYIILKRIYRDLKIINGYEKRMYEAKKITIKIIIDKCQCKTCLNAAYYIYQL